MPGKEGVLIELREDQLRALDTDPQPVAVVDPRTGQEYLLIKREVYDLVCGMLKPYNRRWDPEDGLSPLGKVHGIEESVTYQAILRKGEARGRLEQSRSMLLHYGRKRFGSPDAATVARLEAITDLTRLHQMADRASDVATWDELLAVA